MTESRRLRTQAERDADRWRPGGVVSGEPVHVELDPDECVLVVREGVGVMCVRDHHQHDADIWMTTESVNAAKPPPADKSWIEMTCTPPRRRWWHRYTRRPR